MLPGVQLGVVVLVGPRLFIKYIFILLKIRILCYDLTNLKKNRQIKVCHDIIDLTSPLRSYNAPDLTEAFLSYIYNSRNEVSQ